MAASAPKQRMAGWRRAPGGLLVGGGVTTNGYLARGGVWDGWGRCRRQVCWAEDGAAIEADRRASQKMPAEGARGPVKRPGGCEGLGWGCGKKAAGALEEPPRGFSPTPPGGSWGWKCPDCAALRALGRGGRWGWGPARPSVGG